LIFFLKVPLHIVNARREQLSELLRKGRYLSVTEICQRLGISEATARRDLVSLSGNGKIKRTYGGALGDFEGKFPAFRDRQMIAREAKTRIALGAVRRLKPGKICFFDAGTTMLAVAKELVRNPVRRLTIVTNNLPVAEALRSVEGLETHLLGGLFLDRQAILLGAKACQAAQFWKFDAAFLSAQAMDAQGIWNTQADVVTLQRAILQRSKQVFFCIDASKAGKSTDHLLVPWPDVSQIISDTTVPQLSKIGIYLQKQQIIAV
jgi:DeoR/GlpR family transcriptional regulator of sugar metabolism